MGLFQSVGTLLKKGAGGIWDELLVHGLFEAGKSIVKEEGTEMIKKGIKKFGKEHRIEAMLLLTRACYALSDPNEVQGARNIIDYYSRLSAEGRERFERLLGYVWSVMQDGIGALDLKEVKKTTDKKSGTTTVVSVPATKPDEMFMRHWANVGMLGDAHIAIMLDMIEQQSLPQRIADMAKAAGQKTAGGFEDFINGFKSEWEK